MSLRTVLAGRKLESIFCPSQLLLEDAKRAAVVQQRVSNWEPLDWISLLPMSSPDSLFSLSLNLPIYNMGIIVLIQGSCEVCNNNMCFKTSERLMQMLSSRAQPLDFDAACRTVCFCFLLTHDSLRDFRWGPNGFVLSSEMVVYGLNQKLKVNSKALFCGVQFLKNFWRFITYFQLLFTFLKWWTIIKLVQITFF